MKIFLWADLEFPPRKGLSFSLTLVPCKFTSRFQHLRLSQMSPCLGALVTGRQPRVGGAPFVCPPFLLREHFLPWPPVSLFGPSPTTLYLHPIQPYWPRRSTQNMPSSRLLHRVFSSNRTPPTPFLRACLTLHQICLTVVHSWRLRLTRVLKSIVL